MAYRKKTLRSMSPEARKLARLIGELESTARRLKPLVETVKRLEFEAQALANARVPSPIERVQEEMMKINQLRNPKIAIFGKD